MTIDITITFSLVKMFTLVINYTGRQNLTSQSAAIKNTREIYNHKVLKMDRKMATVNQSNRNMK